VNDTAFLRHIVQTYLQEYLEQEMAHHLAALPYERNTTRCGYRKGYKPRQLNTRVRKLLLSVLQDRDSSFKTELFERYQRSAQLFAGDGDQRHSHPEGATGS